MNFYLGETPLFYVVVPPRRSDPLPDGSLDAVFSDRGVLSRPLIRGTVRDAGSNAVLSGVTVRVKGTTTPTATDAQGRFSLIVGTGFEDRVRVLPADPGFLL